MVLMHRVEEEASGEKKKVYILWKHEEIKMNINTGKGNLGTEYGKK